MRIMLLSRILLTITLILVVSLDNIPTSLAKGDDNNNNNNGNNNNNVNDSNKNNNDEAKEEEENQQQQEEKEEQPCYDDNPKCSEWSSKGECEKNPNYMLPNCRYSCDNCFKQRDVNPLLIHYEDYDIGGVAGAGGGGLDVGKDLGIEQQLTGFDDGTTKHDIEYIISKSRNYMILMKEKYENNNDNNNNNNDDDDDDQTTTTDLIINKTSSSCKNKNSKCSYYALLGKCYTDYDYMIKECAPVCSLCYLSNNDNKIK